MTNQPTSLKRWTTKAGLPAKVVYFLPQHYDLGAWYCGYVEEPIGSFLEGVNYYDNPASYVLKNVQVQGGITYSGGI